MENERTRRPWYKTWWGVVIAILLLPYFLAWFIWARTRWSTWTKAGTTVALVLVIFCSFGAYASTLPQQPPTSTAEVSVAKSVSPTHTPGVTPKPTPKATPSKSPAATPKATATPAATHTVVYSWGVDKGRLTSGDLQQVGISWHDPSTGQNQIPSDVLGAIAQISKAGYSVTYHVASVNDQKIYAGINNYNDPDAAISCTIMVDGQLLVTAEAAPSDAGDCYRDPALRQQSGQ